MAGVFERTNIVLLDTEYTSWEGCIDNGWDDSSGQHREIVQLAAVLVDTRSLAIGDSFNTLVRPQINPQLSEYFVSLTGIRQEDIENSHRFEPVARSFLDWIGEYHVYSWGEEIEVLNENVNLYDATVSFTEEQFYDIRPVFETYDIPVEEYTSGTVSKFFNAAPECGNCHDALYDCKSLFLTLREARTQRTDSY